MAHSGSMSPRLVDATNELAQSSAPEREEDAKCEQARACTPNEVGNPALGAWDS